MMGARAAPPANRRNPAPAVNSYDITLKPGSNLISLPLIPDDNADVGQDQRDIGSAEESPAYAGLGPSLTLAGPAPDVLEWKRVDSSTLGPGHADHDTTSTDSLAVSSVDTSGGVRNILQGKVLMAPEASISCNFPPTPTANLPFYIDIVVTNHTMAPTTETTELFVKVTFAREIYGWKYEHTFGRFTLARNGTNEGEVKFHSPLPGKGYAIECELREHRTRILFFGKRDRSVHLDRKMFPLTDYHFDSNDKNIDVIRSSTCSASKVNLQTGETVKLTANAKQTVKGDYSQYALGFVEIFRGDRFVDSYPPPKSGFLGLKNPRLDGKKKVAILRTHPADKTQLYSYSFTPTSRGRYTAYCFLNTGQIPSARNVTDEDIDLDEFERVFALAAAALMNTSTAQGLAHHTWTEVFRALKLFSQLESITAVDFCVGDPEEDCKFYSTSDDESSGEPDLEVESLTVSKSAMEPGETFTLTASVLNSGSGTSSETTLRYYRSTTTTFSTSVMEDPVIDVIGLDPSDTERVSHPLVAPSDPGLYYYRTCVAPASGESDTDNNCSTGVLVTVEATQQGSPDLVVEAPSVSKNEIQPGGRFTLFATVRNIGDARAGSAILWYYRSTDSSISAGSDTKVGSDTVNSLQPSRTDGESVGVSAPEAPGEYYYGACVVRVTGGESDTGNNCSSGRRVTVVQTTHTSPDLVVDSPSVSQNEVDAGGRFTLRTTVRNSGDGPAPAATLRYYRSADSAITTGDAEVETDRVGYLDPSETGDEWERLTAPSSAGTYYYGACVDSVTDESDTNNNCSSGVQVTVIEALQNSPDLVVSVSVVSVSIGDTELEPGETFAVTSWVSNSGLATSPATTLRIYRSTDSSISAGDTVIGVGNVRSLAPSETQGYDLRNQIAPSVAGTYYYGSCVESVSGESDTNNNCSSGVRVTVEQTNPAAAFARNPALDFNGLAADGIRGMRGLWSDGTTMWVSDITDARIYAYGLADRARVPARDFSTLRAAGNINPTGIWSDGTTMWVADITDARIYAYELADRARVPARDFSTLRAAGNINPRGIWTDGTTMWVADWSGSKIYAYDMMTGARVPARDFNTLAAAGNNNPEGIWSDGTTMWVADLRDARIYAYNMPSAGDAATDRAALVALYNATGGANWGNNGNWLSNAPMGEWHGVITDSDGRVTHLHLHRNQLTGAIPAELGYLTNVEVLRLASNQLTGEIPAELGDLSNLEYLYLFNNQLTGEIPAELGNLTNLKWLHLSSNQLTGEIPAELGNLTNLRWLRLYDNQLTGEIPAELGDLTNLKGLRLYDNQLTGEIPAELGDLTNLTELQLRSNQLTGCIPEGLRNIRRNDFGQLGLPFCGS